MSQIFRKILPHLIVIAAFVGISAIYFYPAFTGNQLKQGDITHFRGMSQEISEYRRMFGEEPLWTNSMFAGMPAYQISVLYPNDILRFVDQVITLGLPVPVKYLFLYMVGFYLLLLAFRLKPGLAAVGALAFAFSSYFIIIIEAGHNSKAHAIGYLAPVLAGIIWTFRGKFLLGAAVTAFFVALQVHANHVQITYYFGILVAFYALARLINAFRQKAVPQFVKASAFLIVAGAIGVLANSNILWNTYNYSKATTRGTSELTINPDGSSNQSNVTAGLDRDYVTQWSYGIGETFSLLIPNAHGGESGALIDENTQKENPQLYNDLARGYQATNVFPNTYWGDQPFTSGPVYVGALIVLLFLLGAFFIQGPIKWALVATAILTIMLAWGKNFMGLTDFFLDYIPGYHKFRAVTIILSITELVFPLLGFLFLKKVYQEPDFLITRKKKFLAVSGALVGLLLLLLAIPDTFFSFLSSNESNAFNAAIGGNAGVDVLNYAEALKAQRIANFRGDTFRSLAFVLLGISLIWAFANRKLKTPILIGALALLVIIDLWSVDKRYLNNEKVRGKFVQWQPKEDAKSAYLATPADLEILKREEQNNPRLTDEINGAVSAFKTEQKTKGKSDLNQINDVKFAALRFNTDYRVLPLQGTFQDARTAYFHKSIGGYHGAKLKRIQEVYDFYIAPEMSAIINALQNDPTVDNVNRVLRNNSVLNMLNTKYIIYNNDAPPMENPFALGSAWFVEDLVKVSDADQEIQELGDIDIRTEAVVDERFADELSGFSYQEAADAQIAVETHLPNYIKYLYESPVPQATIFSEMYYADGWNAYLDGKKVDYFRANYLLRAMIIPEGVHTIEFKFMPQSFATANIVSSIFTVAVLLLLVFGFWSERRNMKSDEVWPEAVES
ncbi:YfhO family protein [Cryomorpha ignava]|uniref:YfhO family protein n=1 Tax=Cryomorpha ignava TaxID=101383 RepID=A0A7K3WML7_9FLAO|nr:YfhO family protein [Cryomorpha ignava]NEN22724.1 YfhO family protein [Cryomorpha ignava]